MVSYDDPITSSNHRLIILKKIHFYLLKFYDLDIKFCYNIFCDIIYNISHDISSHKSEPFLNVILIRVLQLVNIKIWPA